MKGPKNLTGQAEHLMSRFIRQDDVPSVRNIEIRIVSLFRGDGKEAYNCNMYCRSTEKASQKTGSTHVTCRDVMIHSLSLLLEMLVKGVTNPMNLNFSDMSRL